MRDLPSPSLQSDTMRYLSHHYRSISEQYRQQQQHHHGKCYHHAHHSFSSSSLFSSNRSPSLYRVIQQGIEQVLASPTSGPAINNNLELDMSAETLGHANNASLSIAAPLSSSLSDLYASTISSLEHVGEALQHHDQLTPPTQTPPASSSDESMSLWTVENILIITFYSLIILVSLTGNSLVCRVAFGNRDMRTTTNLLIGSLATSDMFMTLFNIPFNVARILPISWPFGSAVCILVPWVQTSCVYVSTFTMTVIALHRFWTVRQKRSTTGQTSIKHVALIVFSIWMLAITISMPHAIFNRVKEKTFNNHTFIRCMKIYPELAFNFALFFTVEVLITQYLIPLSITLVVYILIGRIIARQGALICKLSDEKKRKQSEAKRRRIFMLALAVATFATCWAPINLYLFLCDTGIVKFDQNIYIVSHWFAVSSTCYNPIIYCWLNERFRSGAMQSIRTILNLKMFHLGSDEKPPASNSI